MSTSNPDPAPTPDSAPSPDLPAEDAPGARVVDVADASKVRRAPRYGRFGFAGFLLGAIISLALTYLPVAQYELTRGQLFLLLLLGLGTAGIFAGLVVALGSDRRSLRRRDRR